MSELEISDQYFDLSFLLEIADGSTEFIVESIGMFLQQTPELMQTIDTAIAADDRAVLGAAAHKLKPNLGFFGMASTQKLMQEIESLSKNGGDMADIKLKFNTVKEIVPACLVKLNTIKTYKEATL